MKISLLRCIHLPGRLSKPSGGNQSFPEFQKQLFSGRSNQLQTGVLPACRVCHNHGRVPPHYHYILFYSGFDSHRSEIIDCISGVIFLPGTPCFLLLFLCRKLLPAEFRQESTADQPDWQGFAAVIFCETMIGNDERKENHMGNQEETGKIVICDSEADYGERLMEYLKGHLSFPCEMELYTSAEKWKSFREKSEGKTALLIVAEREYEEGAGRTEEGSVLVLNETGQYLGENVRSVSKYQSTDVILEIVKELAMGQEGTVPGMIRHGTGCRIIGCYTPISRCLQTTFSLAFGQLLARQHKVLYLNFENYPGLDRMLGRSFRGTVADLLYYNECARERLTAQLALLTENLNGLDYIPPMKSFTELRAVRKEQWLELFHSLEEITDYEYVILDLSESTDGLFSILRECEQIFTIVRDDEWSRAKVTAYEQLLQSGGCEDIAAKTRRCRFPIFRELPAALENLTHGEMEDKVRKIMEEEGYGGT